MTRMNQTSQEAYGQAALAQRALNEFRIEAQKMTKSHGQQIALAQESARQQASRSDSEAIAQLQQDLAAARAEAAALRQEQSQTKGQGRDLLLREIRDLQAENAKMVDRCS